MIRLTLHKRKPLTTKERVQLFHDHGGKCCLCGGKIHAPKEKWIDEHELALALGGSNEWENRGPAHVSCAREKTRKDMAAIAEAKRREAKHIGATRKTSRPLSGSKASGLRKRMNGTVERRT